MKTTKIAFTTVVTFFLLSTNLIARSEIQNKILGTWVGQLANFNIVIEIQENSQGQLQGVFYNLSRNVTPITIDSIKAETENIMLVINTFQAKLEGTIDIEGNNLKLKWSQGGPLLPVNLTRSDPVPEVEKRKAFKLPEGMHPNAPMELADWSFLVGEWHGKYTQPIGGGRTGEFLLVWKGEWILNGRAVQNTSQTWALQPDGQKGQMIQHGVDTRSFNSLTKQYSHSYLDGLSGEIKLHPWKMIDGELRSEPTEWNDYEGRNLNIIIIREVTKDRFVWAVDRSFDKGKSWKKDYVVIENVRIK